MVVLSDSSYLEYGFHWMIPSRSDHQLNSHKVQMVMSGKQPSLFWCDPSFEMFMSMWGPCRTHPRLSQWIDIGMDKAKEYYGRIGSHCCLHNIDFESVIHDCSLLTVISFESSIRMSWSGSTGRLSTLKTRTEDQSNIIVQWSITVQYVK